MVVPGPRSLPSPLVVTRLRQDHFATQHHFHHTELGTKRDARRGDAGNRFTSRNS